MLTLFLSDSVHQKMEPFSDVAGAIRAGRALVGLRQEELAELAGVSRQMLARIENEDETISYQAIEKVRRALEREGVIFLPDTEAIGTGVARRKKGR